MPHVVPDLPSTKADGATYATYYKALVDDYDPVKSGMTAFETAEMEAALALIPRSTADKFLRSTLVLGTRRAIGRLLESQARAILFS